MTTINQKTLMDSVVPLPELKEQNEIALVLQACDSKIASLELEADLLKELFRVMLEQLMTGQLSVTPLIEES